jgi:hypothetical protein
VAIQEIKTQKICHLDPIVTTLDGKTKCGEFKKKTREDFFVGGFYFSQVLFITNPKNIQSLTP